MSGIDEVKRGLAEWCAVAAERTAEAARVTSRRYDKFAIGREIERKLAELGSLVHEGLRAGREDILADPRVADLRRAVLDLERERELKDEEIDGIRQEYAERRQGGAGGIGDPATRSEGAGLGGNGPGDGGPADTGPGNSGDRKPDFSD